MPRPTRPLRLSRLAEADLEAIYDYTAERWSPRQAKAYLDGLNATLLDLQADRRIGRDADVGFGFLKIRHEAHLIFYRIDDIGVDVARILHSAMDAVRHFYGEPPSHQ